MNVSPYYEQAIRSYSAEDKAFFDRATGMLPVRKETTPYHSGPHSVRSLRMAYELAGRPANVLEIGFCLGHSAALWLALGAQHVTSLENSTRDESIEASHIMRRTFGARFRLAFCLFGVYPAVNDATFAFVDGDHSVEGVDRDTAWVLSLGIKSILFDDLPPHWGPGTMPAIQKHRLVPLAILGTMCLCRPAYET
jgi:hypothetical protein